MTATGLAAVAMKEFSASTLVAFNNDGSLHQASVLSWTKPLEVIWSSLTGN